MFSFENLKIDLLAIKDNPVELSLLLDDEYFQGLDDAEIQSGKVNASLSIRKAVDGEFAFTLRIEGVVTVTCDLCLDDMEQPVEGESSFIIRLGQEGGTEDDIIVVDENDGVLDTAWLIYETIALAIPIKHVHAPGKCNAAMTEKLQELSATRSGDGVAENEIDPRWAKLQQLSQNK